MPEAFACCSLPMNRSASCPNSQRVESRTASKNSTGFCNDDALRLGTSRAPVQGFNAPMFRAILSQRERVRVRENGAFQIEVLIVEMRAIKVKPVLAVLALYSELPKAY